MRHVTLTCLHHPELRWSCKSIAVNERGQYNGLRHIFFLGEVKKEKYVDECKCKAADLRFYPEEIELQKTNPLD